MPDTDDAVAASVATTPAPAHDDALPPSSSDGMDPKVPNAPWFDLDDACYGHPLIDEAHRLMDYHVF